MKVKLILLFLVCIFFNTLMFFLISSYNIAAYGLVTIALFKTGGIFMSFTKFDYSDGFKVSFAFISIFIGFSQILGIVIFKLFDHLHLFSLFFILILFMEIIFMIIYAKKNALYGN